MDLSIYKLGNIIVDTDYEKPTKEKFLLWREDFLSDVGDTNFDFLFVGNAAEKFYGVSELETFDVDIFFSSSRPYYTQMKKVFDSAIQRGIEHKIFIDIFYVSKNVFDNTLFENFTFMRPYFKIEFKNGEVWETNRRYKKVVDGIFSTDVRRETMPAYKKWIKRQEEGHYQGLRFDLRTMENKNII